MLKARSFPVMLAVALALVPGCGGPQADEATQPVVQAANLNQMNPVPREQIAVGGKLIWAIATAPSNFNYNHLDGTLQDGAWIINAVMPMPMDFDAGGTASFNPNFLTREPTLETEPEMRVTYHLNPAGVWSDGTPITAEDYIWQWKALSGDNPAYRIASSNGYDQIKDVAQGADRFEVKITFKAPYADWRALFQPLYPAATNRDPAVFNDAWKSTFLVSGGPFRFQSYDPTAKIYTLVRNEKWWGEPALLDSLIFRVVATDAQATAMANGEVDLISVGSSVDIYNKVRVIPDVEVRVAGGPNFRHLTFNGQSEMLRDVMVRRAVAMAIDRGVIARSQLGPLPVVPVALNNHIFMSNQVGYQDNSGVVAYDPEAAGRLLDSLGWKLEGEVRAKAGKQLRLQLLIPGGVSVSRAESELIQNMLSKVGVKAEINTVPADVFFPGYVSPGKFDLVLFSWMGTQFPISSSQSIYRMPTGDDPRQNYGRVGSRVLDSLYAATVAQLDPATARGMANQVDSLIWDEVHSLTLYQRPDIWGVKASFANVGAYGFAIIRYENIGRVK